MVNALRGPAPVDRSARGWLGDLAAGAALVLGAAVVWILHVVRSGTVVSPMDAGDSFGYFLPAYAYEAARVAAGGFPFWNPYQGGGVPFLATLQAGALYPARLLMIAMSPPRAMGWSAFLHVLVALLGTFALCRRLDATRAAAALGAIVFTTAFALPSITAPTLLEPGVWLPVAALAIVAIVEGAGWAWALVLGVAMAMPPLAGGYQMTLYTVYGAAIFALAVAIDRRARGERLRARAFAQLALAGVLAFATAAPQIIPTLAWTPHTVRQAKPLTDMQMMPVFTESTRWHHVVAFFFRTSPIAVGYLSIPVVVLALIGLVRGRPAARVLALAALATATLAVVRSNTFLFAVYKAIPGFAMFRFPLRLGQLTSLLVGVTAALGLSALGRLPALAPARRRAAVDAAALAVVIALLVWPFRNEVAMPWSDGAALAKPDPAFFPGAIRPPAAERVYVPGDRFDLRLGAFVRQGTFQRVRVLQDYEPLSSRRLAAFLSAIAGIAPPGPDAFPIFNGALRVPRGFANPDLLDLVAVSTIVAPRSAVPPIGIPGWTRIQSAGELGTWRNARALPRAYVVPRARWVADETQALELLTAGSDFDPRREVVLVGAPTTEAERALASAAPAPLEPARLVIDDPEHVAAEVAPAAGGLLVLADAFAPGWEAAVDGRWRRVWQANHFVRAVEIRPGDRLVEFRYHAPGFALGTAFFAVVWSTTLGGLALAGLRRRARATGAA